MLQSKHTINLIPNQGDTFGPYAYRYNTMSIQTGARWNGSTGTVMEILSVRFVWDFGNQYVTSPGSNPAEFGFQSGGRTNTPTTAALGPQQAELVWSAGIRMADKSTSTTNTAKWPDERFDPAWLATSKKGTYVFFSRQTNAERFFFTAMMFEHDTLWNYNDGLGNGLRVNSEHLTLHSRVDWKDTISDADVANKVLEPPDASDVLSDACPPQYIHVYITYKYREVDVYEWQRLTATHNSVDAK